MSKLKAKDPAMVEPGKTKGLIFGKSGAGKTWFALSFPAPYYIDTESGASLRHYQERLKLAGGAYLGVEDGSLDFNVIIDQMTALSTEKHPYKTLIIDSITKVYQSSIASEYDRLYEKSKNTSMFGAEKKPAISQMRRIINKAMRLDMNVWFVAHEVTEWGKADGGTREEIGKIPDVWEKLVYELDLGIQVIRRGNSYPAFGIVKKSRLLGFPENESFELTYDEFAKRYGKDFIEKSVKQEVLATEEQVKELIRITDLLKIDEETIEKIFTKAKADKWEDLTLEHAEKTIEFYTAKLSKGAK
jgi:hypothetical protein